MDEPLGRQGSKIQDDGIPHGCMGGLLHFLDFNQRFHVRKMLAYNKRSVGKNAERTRSPKVKQDESTAEGSSFTDKDENIQFHAEDKGGITRNNSGKVLRRSLNSKRRHGDLNQTTPLTAHLLRTFSIHHLDSNDYVDNVAHNNENLHEGSQSEPHGGQTKLNKIPDYLLEKHSLLRDKLINAKEASSKKKGSDAKELEHDAASYQSKELMEMMVLLNNNRELLLKILKDPSSVASFLEMQKTSSADRVLDKSGSFPITSLPCCQRDEMSNRKHKMRKSESLVYERENLHAGTSSKVPNFNKNTFESPKLSSSFEMKDQSESQRDNRTALSRFKIIKRRIKDVVKDNGKEGLRISMDGVLHKVPYGSKLSKDAKKEKQGLLDSNNSRSKSIKRSHSLNESLDKYSRLLESISSGESKRTPEQPKLKQEDSGRLLGGKPAKTLARIFSLPDFDSSSSKKSVQYEVFDATQSLKIPMTVDVCDISDPKVVDVFGDKEESLESGTFLAEVLEKDTSGMMLEGQGYQSPISDLELYSPETLELKFSHIHSEELDSLTYHRTQLSIDASDQSEAGIEDSELQVPSELDCYYSFFNVQVDPQNEALFNYVRDILWKAGFGTDEFLRAWYSSNQPVDPFLSQEVECSSNAEMVFEHQLLFDLINEVLLEIYDNSSSCCPWLSRFDMHTRPMPSGHHVLEEVWANISWHLNSQPQLDPTLDHAVARDFAKNDGWMDIQYDCEDLGLEVEDLILDDLLYEVVLELDDTHL